MNPFQQSQLWLRLPVVWAFFGYALLARLAPYVLNDAFGWPLQRAYDAWPWNFSPLYALAILGGAAFSWRLALAAPLAVFVIGDLMIAAISGDKWGFYGAQAFTYLGIVYVAACGLPLRSGTSPVRIAAAGLGGATVFFLVTNLGVWLTGGGFSRPWTPAGLAACFVDAIPFYGPTVLSMAVFLPVLFSPMVLRSSEPLHHEEVVV